jgi:hypothetical protein
VRPSAPYALVRDAIDTNPRKRSQSLLAFLACGTGITDWELSERNYTQILTKILGVITPYLD